MTEAEWMACTDPDPMLEFLRGKVTDRKLRLFGVACCRLLLQRVRVNSWDEQAVDVAERFADGKATTTELEAAAAGTTPDWTAAFACHEAASLEGGVDAAEYAADNAAWEAGSHAAFVVGKAEGSPSFNAGRDVERAAQANLLRDIFGPLPFRPVTVHPHTLAWNDRLVVRLSQAIYDERRWGDMPILSDALLDAGCDDDEVLAHCRSGGEHVRGCWVIDLLLGKQ